MFVRRCLPHVVVASRRRLWRCLPVLALFVAASCINDEDDFAIRMAKHACKHQEKCTKSRFVNNYDGDMHECRDDVAEAIENWIDNSERLGCDFDEEEAIKCEREASKRRNECGDDPADDVADACDDVMDGVVCAFPIELVW